MSTPMTITRGLGEVGRARAGLLAVETAATRHRGHCGGTRGLYVGGTQ